MASQTLLYGSQPSQSPVLLQDLTSPTAVSDWIGLSGGVCVQFNGNATAVTAIVERSSTNPAGSNGANVAPAAPVPITGNPNAGMAPSAFVEPATGWWRVRLIAMTGSDVMVSISGQGSVGQ